jgi:TfoX/Sxy family transcriptional regulator of competence genes
MAYDKALAQRIRELLAGTPDLIEKKMFGGVGFLLRGNMACGVNQDRLIVRVGPERYEEALAYPQAAPFDMTGRPMKGWVFVHPEGTQSNDELRAWVQQGIDFALTLPPK